MKAHGELIVCDSSQRPSVRACVRPCVRPSVRACAHASTLSNMNISETSWPIIIKFYQEHIWAGGIDCIRFWVRSDQNSGFHGNR